MRYTSFLYPLLTIFLQQDLSRAREISEVNRHVPTHSSYHNATVRSRNLDLTPPHVLGLTVSGFRITLDSTSLDSVASHFGASLVQRDSAGDHFPQVCLLVNDSTHPATLVLESGIMAGTKNEVLGFRLDRRSSASQSGCSNVSIGYADITIDHSLQLGMTQQAVEQALGSGTTSSGSVVTYEDQVSLSSPPAPTSGCSDSFITEVIYDSGTAVRVGAWRVGAC